MNKTGWMPETIGTQVQVLYWSASEIVIPLFLLIFGLVSGLYKLTPVAIAVYCYIYTKVKHKIPRGYATNLLYMAGLLDFKTAPSFFANKFEE